MHGGLRNYPAVAARPAQSHERGRRGVRRHLGMLHSELMRHAPAAAPAAAAAAAARNARAPDFCTLVCLLCVGLPFCAQATACAGLETSRSILSS